MNREEAKKIATGRAEEYEDAFEYEGAHAWDGAREGFRDGFMAAYDLLITPNPVQRSWEIIGGDPSVASGYEKPFLKLNKAVEHLEFLQENCPDQPWELKEIK